MVGRCISKGLYIRSLVRYHRIRYGQIRAIVSKTEKPYNTLEFYLVD